MRSRESSYCNDIRLTFPNSQLHFRNEKVFSVSHLLNSCWISSIINSIIKSSFKRDPDLHNHALDALMRGESFNDSTNHQKKFKSGDGGMVAVGDLKGLLLLFPSALTQLVLLQLNMSEKNFPLHVKCKY